MLAFVHKKYIQLDSNDWINQLPALQGNGEMIVLQDLPAEEVLAQLQTYLHHPYYVLVEVDEQLPAGWRWFDSVHADGISESGYQCVRSYLMQKDEEILQQADRQEQELRLALDMNLPEAAREAVQERLEELERHSSEWRYMLKLWQEEVAAQWASCCKVQHRTITDWVQQLQYNVVYIPERQLLHVRQITKHPSLPLMEQIQDKDQLDRLIRELLSTELRQQDIPKGMENHHIRLVLYANHVDAVQWWNYQAESLPVSDRYDPLVISNQEA